MKGGRIQQAPKERRSPAGIKTARETPPHFILDTKRKPVVFSQKRHHRKPDRGKNRPVGAKTRKEVRHEAFSCGRGGTGPGLSRIRRVCPENDQGVDSHRRDRGRLLSLRRRNRKRHIEIHTGRGGHRRGDGRSRGQPEARRRGGGRFRLRLPGPRLGRHPGPGLLQRHEVPDPHSGPPLRELFPLRDAGKQQHQVCGRP